MQHVAFLRNVNQGQRGQPSTADISAAFTAAGAPDAQTFQSNGTVVFVAADPGRVAEAAREHLARHAGIDTPVMTRSLAFVEEIVDRNAEAADFSRRELTLFAPPGRPYDVEAVAAQATRRGCAVVEHGVDWAVVRNDADRQSNGTPALEAALGVPATSRGLPTLLRLVDRFCR